jgi:hypothetical protein
MGSHCRQFDFDNGSGRARESGQTLPGVAEVPPAKDPKCTLLCRELKKEGTALASFPHPREVNQGVFSPVS